MKKGKIFNFQHFSVNDGPGIRTVVFFKGCPLDCIWCHNPESKCPEPEMLFYKSACTICGRCADVCINSVHHLIGSNHVIDKEKCIMCGKCTEICPSNAIETVGKEYSVDEVMYELSKDDIFFGKDGGVTFSGGEPFMQFDFMYELLKKCKEKGYSVCIETSGFTTADNIIKAAEYTDCFLYDCKETNAHNHKKYVGSDNKRIVENLKILNEINAGVILRCPIIPGCNDNKEHFMKIGSIADRYDNILRIEIEPYHSLGERKNAALGRKEHQFGKVTEHEKATWIDCVQKHTHKKVKLA